MNKLLVICGPTATGKTRLGIELAQKFNGEIVSADSRQIYRGMDIITGKDLPADAKFRKNKESIIGYYEINKILFWMLDIVEPDQKFSAADYYSLAWNVIKDIWRRKKLPIVVGGTCFYIKALLEGIETIGVGPDWQLRKRLSSYSVNALTEELKRIDQKKWESMNESDKRNPRRLIRAIELAMAKKQGIRKEIPKKIMKLNSLLIGLTAPNKVLYQRIDQRVDERVVAGAQKEVEDLLKKGYNWDNSVLGETIGYREWRDFFEGKVAKEEAIVRWKFDEHAYARRQMTFLKKLILEHKGRLFNIVNENYKEEVENLIKDWYI